MPDISLAELPTDAVKSAVNALGRMIAAGNTFHATILAADAPQARARMNRMLEQNMAIANKIDPANSA